ncbi:MAG: hypothetical protein H8E90_05990 [Anaerolineales bacterium]|nr:hypothetical protein [Anaerolineales bacterium]
MRLQIGVIFTPGPVGWFVQKLGLRFSHAFIRYEKPEGWWLMDSGLWRIKDRPSTGLERATDYVILETKEPLDPNTAQRIIDYARGNVGKPYHIWGAIRLGWRLLRQRFGFQALAYPSYICTDFVVDCFHYVGIDLVPPGQLLVLPDEIAASDKLVEVPAADNTTSN